MDRHEESGHDILEERHHAHGLGIGRCGCGRGCGMVVLGMKDKDGTLIKTWQFHWSETRQFLNDILEQAEAARDEEMIACGRKN